MSESYVQLAPDSTGKNVRTLEVTSIETDGSTATTEMQVVSIANSDGRVLDLDINSSLEEIAFLMKKQLEYLELIAGILGG